MTTRLLYATLFVLLIACNKKVEEPPPGKVNLVPTPKPVTSAVSADPRIDLESMPVEEDYEVEAEKEITLKNLEKKVGELEKEIAGK